MRYVKIELVVAVTDDYLLTEGVSQVGIQVEKSIDAHDDLYVSELDLIEVRLNPGKRRNKHR